MPQFKCTLQGCNHSTHKGQGHAAHQRAHVIRGEATYADEGHKVLVSTGVPIVTDAYGRKKRMDEIRSGKLKADIRLPSKSRSTALAKPKAKATQVSITSRQSTATIDVTQLTPEQIETLKREFAVGTPVTPSDRLKEALVLNTVAEMLDERPAGEVLLLLEQMRRMPLMR